MNYIKMVEKFHNAFNAPILPTPQIPSEKRCDLRISLMKEELNEIKHEIKYYKSLFKKISNERENIDF
jgi:hypothetical protein